MLGVMARSAETARLRNSYSLDVSILILMDCFVATIVKSEELGARRLPAITNKSIIIL